jgi:integrase
MASLIKGNRNRLCLEFRWQGKVYRPSVGKGVRATKENRRQYASLERRVTHAIKEGTFTLEEFFPNSMAAKALKAVAEAEAAAAPVMVLRVVARQWLNTQKYRSAKTTKGVEYLFSRFLDGTALGEMDVREIMRKDIQAAIDGVERRSDRPGKPDRLIAQFIQRLRKIFLMLEADEVISKNPMKFIENPPSGATEEIDPIPPADQLKLSAVAKTVQDWSIVELGFALGPRPSEVLGLLREDLPDTGKWATIRGTKTKRAHRTVKLPPRNAARLMAVLSRLDIPIDETGLIFRGRRGARLNLQNWTNRNWRPMFKATGLKYRAPNVMRHSFAVDCFEQGLTPGQVAELMGDRLETVFKYYARYIYSAARDEHEPERFTASTQEPVDETIPDAGEGRVNDDRLDV